MFTFFDPSLIFSLLFLLYIRASLSLTLVLYSFLRFVYFCVLFFFLKILPYFLQIFCNQTKSLNETKNWCMEKVAPNSSFIFILINWSVSIAIQTDNCFNHWNMHGWILLQRIALSIPNHSHTLTNPPQIHKYMSTVHTHRYIKIIVKWTLAHYVMSVINERICYYKIANQGA